MPGFDMSDYVPVNERVAAFLEKHADGSLQSEIVELTESRVTVKAYAYRSPDDARPGIGHSSLEIPGKTTFTRGSEIENAETSAWGRAIAALGFEVKRGLASAEEVRNKQPQERSERVSSTGKREPAKTSAPAVPNQYRRGELAELMKAHNLDLNAVEAFSVAVGISRDERPMSDESMDKLIDAIRESVALDTSAAARAADQDGAPLPSEELSDASGIVPDPAGAPPVPPELQERIDKARSRGKKADEPMQESLLGEPVA